LASSPEDAAEGDGLENASATSDAASITVTPVRDRLRGKLRTVG